MPFFLPRPGEEDSVWGSLRWIREGTGLERLAGLSHLGTYENAYKPSDTQLAKSTRYIDVIIGGHTHKTVTNHYVQNMDGDSVLLAQMGKSGAKMGKITLKMTK